MSGRVVDGKSAPDLAAGLRTIEIGRSLAAVDIEVVHHEVDGLSFRILHGQVEDYLGKPERRTVGRRKDEVPARFGLYRAEDIGRTAAFIFVIASGFPAGCGR